MFLAQRLLGVVTYCIVLLIFVLWVRSTENKLGRILFFYSIVLSVMAFYFVPNSGADLSRLWVISEAYARVDFREFFSWNATSATPIAGLYLYALGRTNIRGLLPGITAFVFYTNVFYIIKDSAKRLGTTSREQAIVLFYVMSTGVFLEVISGIRSMLSLSIMAVCIYKEFFNNRALITSVLPYGIAMLIHPIAIPVFIMRIAFYPFQQESKALSKIVNVLVAVILAVILLTAGYPYLIQMTDKAGKYISRDSYSYFWEYLKAFLGFILIVAILIRTKRRLFIERNITSGNAFSNVKNYFSVVTLLSLVNGIFFFEYNIFHRLMSFNTIVSIPLVFYSIGFRNRGTGWFKSTLLLVSLLILLIAVTRGNLSSYKFIP